VQKERVVACFENFDFFANFLKKIVEKRNFSL